MRIQVYYINLILYIEVSRKYFTENILHSYGPPAHFPIIKYIMKRIHMNTK